MRTIKSTPADELQVLIAKDRTDMVEYRALGEHLLAECAEERMNKRLDELAQLSVGSTTSAA
jgi:hypothetical protein